MASLESVRQSVQNELSALFIQDTAEGTPIPEVYAEEIDGAGVCLEIGICFAVGKQSRPQAGFAAMQFPDVECIDVKSVAEFLFFGMAAYWSCTEKPAQCSPAT